MPSVADRDAGAGLRRRPPSSDLVASRPRPTGRRRRSSVTVTSVLFQAGGGGRAGGRGGAVDLDRRAARGGRGVAGLVGDGRRGRQAAPSPEMVASAGRLPRSPKRVAAGPVDRDVAVVPTGAVGARRRRAGEGRCRLVDVDVRDGRRSSCCRPCRSRCPSPTGPHLRSVSVVAPHTSRCPSLRQCTRSSHRPSVLFQPAAFAAGERLPVMVGCVLSRRYDAVPVAGLPGFSRAVLVLVGDQVDRPVPVAAPRGERERPHLSGLVVGLRAGVRPADDHALRVVAGVDGQRQRWCPGGRTRARTKRR